jgi:hypothetical protein
LEILKRTTQKVVMGEKIDFFSPHPFQVVAIIGCKAENDYLPTGQHISAKKDTAYSENLFFFPTCKLRIDSPIF